MASVREASDSKGDGVGKDTGVADNEGPIDRLVNGDKDGEKLLELGAVLKLNQGPPCPCPCPCPP